MLKNKIGLKLCTKANERLNEIPSYQLEFNADILFDDNSPKANVTFYGPLLDLQKELAQMVEDKAEHDLAMRIAEITIRYVFYTKEIYGYRGKQPPIPSSSEEIELYEFFRQYTEGDPIIVEDK